MLCSARHDQLREILPLVRTSNRVKSSSLFLKDMFCYLFPTILSIPDSPTAQAFWKTIYSPYVLGSFWLTE